MFWSLFKCHQRRQRKDVATNSVLKRNGNGSYGTELWQRYNRMAERNGETATEWWKPGIRLILKRSPQQEEQQDQDEY